MARIRITVWTTTHGRVDVEQQFAEVVGASNVADALGRASQIVVDAHQDEVDR
jgi:hypothetical protein